MAGIDPTCSKDSWSQNCTGAKQDRIQATQGEKHNLQRTEVFYQDSTITTMTCAANCLLSGPAGPVGNNHHQTDPKAERLTQPEKLWSFRFCRSTGRTFKLSVRLGQIPPSQGFHFSKISQKYIFKKDNKQKAASWAHEHCSGHNTDKYD